MQLSVVQFTSHVLHLAFRATSELIYALLLAKSEYRTSSLCRRTECSLFRRIVHP